MKTFLLAIVIGIMPLFGFCQTLSTDITISPDSLYFDNQNKQSTTLTNNSNQPINITSVQRNCIGCIGWTWKVDSMTFDTPHFINPGQTESIILQVYGSVLKSSLTGYLHSSVEIGSSVGTQYCHIFISQNLLTAIDEKTEKTIKLYPNPTTSILAFETIENSNNLQSIEIYNFCGQLIFNKTIDGSKFTLNVESYPSGIYMAKIMTSNSNYMRQFTKN